MHSESLSLQSVLEIRLSAILPWKSLLGDSSQAQILPKLVFSAGKILDAAHIDLSSNKSRSILGLLSDSARDEILGRLRGRDSSQSAAQDLGLAGVSC